MVSEDKLSILSRKKKMAQLAADVFAERFRKRFQAYHAELPSAPFEDVMRVLTSHRMARIVQMADEPPECWVTSKVAEILVIARDMDKVIHSSAPHVRRFFDEDISKLFLIAVQSILDYAQMRDSIISKTETLRHQAKFLQDTYYHDITTLATSDAGALDLYKNFITAIGMKHVFDLVTLRDEDWDLKDVLSYSEASKRGESEVERLSALSSHSAKVTLAIIPRITRDYLIILQEIKQSFG